MTETSPIYNLIAAMDAEDDATAALDDDDATTDYGARAVRSAAIPANEAGENRLADHVSVQVSAPREDPMVPRRRRQEMSTAGGGYQLREVEERADGSRRVHREYEDPATGVSYVRDLDG
ncbi:uncharacterized protein BO95DRAFT_441832 [Aspergillus brunneoviolaceus CBS 621.78]|uniref:Uncharacterized protein n=1 Tax=Aspergillus brunneoviolaceus CBS 621.78 TaxID=1450534 RepID=A0ACD1GCP0_9EURO|nr:hypothetical protein BO95DRAFT_441832 [Aspergillus brunneoviolaceus CBS 621.78]RAH46894.1 hypothetical protein BO95DRAFT_441832 [Aspergillus brunneoviolaceus CBS 621.78]